jgi:hypothetical protein
MPSANGYAKKTARILNPGSINKTPRELSLSRKLSKRIEDELILRREKDYLEGSQINSPKLSSMEEDYQSRTSTT